MAANPLIHELLGNGPYEAPGPRHRLVRVEGRDAGEFLHRLCTQDVGGLAEGEAKPAAFLDAKGKLVATCLIARLDAGFWLETTADQLAKLAALLERYHFTEKLTIAVSDLRGLQERVSLAGGTTSLATVHRDGARLALACARRGVRFERVYASPDTTIARAGLPACDDERYECVRMLAGLVRVGVETEPTTLALEVDLDDHISTTKGCYTGQEIVARIHTYGHTNRKLCLLRLAAGEAIVAPQPLHELDERMAVGRVMRCVRLPGRAEHLGVGYLPKDFQALGTALALADGRRVEVIGYEPLAGLPA